jgi:hypothetical protein
VQLSKKKRKKKKKKENTNNIANLPRSPNYVSLFLSKEKRCVHTFFLPCTHRLHSLSDHFSLLFISLFLILYLGKMRDRDRLHRCSVTCARPIRLLLEGRSVGRNPSQKASGTDTARLGYLSPSTRAAVRGCTRARSLRATYLPSCGAFCVAETVGTRPDRHRCNAPRLSLPLCLVCACASLRLCASAPRSLRYRGTSSSELMWGIEVGVGPARCSMWEHLQQHLRLTHLPPYSILGLLHANIVLRLFSLLDYQTYLH